LKRACDFYTTEKYKLKLKLKIMKVLVNECYGGYGISVEAGKLWLERKAIPYEIYEDGYNLILIINGERQYMSHYISRTDETLIEIFEEKGSEFTSGRHAELALEEIPDGCEYDIHEYDGTEYISSTWIKITLDELKNGLSGDRLEMAQKVSCIKLV
jgi:hypothetical protein